MSESLGVDRTKERKDANKFPRRECKGCVRYPCFKGQGTGSHSTNFAAYGCNQYQSKNKQSNNKRRKEDKYGILDSKR